ncbi:MAG TPA: hypothetical protein VFI79_17480, partial [Gemmatimonadales bacterium]|nr:hypothetical protein [Gemmatimonadales bacterium]
SFCFALIGAAPAGAPGPVPSSLLSGLVWRNIGPFRAGRVAAVSGAIGQPGVFYMGLPLGGVWKTTSAGEVWTPIFDSIEEASSVGAVEVAPSDPNVIYVGMGDLITGGGINEGNGVYKSTDAGRTWQHLGLGDTKQIPAILVDPKDPNIVLLAAQGDVHKKSETRGVYRSTDGGKSWTKTLYVDDSTGAQKITWAFDRPDVLLATTVRHYATPITGPARFGPTGGITGAQNAATQTRLFKSTDEGVTWREITGGGLPRMNGRTSVAIAMHTNALRMFLIGNFGLYRSDDGGTTWRQMDAADKRIANGQGGYNCGVYVDPQNPDVVYTINTASYQSTDGGNTFTGFKGAPGGDDPQQLWIDPTNGQRMLLGLDQGAVVTLDGGGTWSSWYNQSTEQVYHLAVDNSYPAWIYASQQDAGAIRIRSRGNQGAITPLDWNPVPGWEWGSEAPDPTNPDIVYATGVGVFKITYPSEQWINVSPNVDPDLKGRTTISQPIAFAPWNPRELITGLNFLMSTTDGGVHWTKLSPDLGFPKDTVPTPDSLRGKPGYLVGGAIQSMALSTVKRGVIWIGTQNGLIKLTQDEGKTWEDVTIPSIPGVASRADILAIDASHFDPATAYVALSLHVTGDYTPYFYRTHDYGKTWTLITTGFATGQPSGSFARVIREDPKTRGLLFAGTESGVYVSFDDGDHWQPLQQNLPNTSYRDIVVHDNDLIVGTYGRGIWVLDDISPLRQMTGTLASEPVHLFTPGEATRVRRNVGNDTPFPPEVPHALNPPDGGLIYYYLASEPAGEITLDVLDAHGSVVRHLTSAAVAPVKEAAQPPEPNFWLAAPLRLSKAAGLNRVNWDLRTDDPPAFSHSFEINANPGLTPPSPQGPLVPPGTYTIRLTVAGTEYRRPITVVNDPRSPAGLADVQVQYGLQAKTVAGMRASWDGYQQVAAARAAVVADTVSTLPAVVVTAAKTLDSTLAAVGGNPDGGRGFGGFRAGPPPPPTFVGVNGTLGGQINALETADMAPTPAMLAAYEATCRDLTKAAATWRGINGPGGAIETFNGVATRNNLKPVGLTAAPVAAPACANPVRAALRNRAANAPRAQSNQQDAENQEHGDEEP